MKTRFGKLLLENHNLALFVIHFSKGIMTNSRFFSEDCGASFNRKGLVIGAYEGCNPGDLKFSKTGEKFNEHVGGKLSQLLKGSKLKVGDTRLFKNVDEDFYAVAVAALGKEGVGYNDGENLDFSKENIRISAGRAARNLQEEGAGMIFIEEFTSAEASCEAGTLATWKYDDLKVNQAPRIKLELYCGEDKDGWNQGKVKADAQNFVRQLEETPSNLMTPTAFTQACVDNLCKCGIQVEVRDKDWIEGKKMGAFLTVSQGSCENPLFLELSYCGTALDDKPVLLVGMGITFDSGGLCLKRDEDMSEHRGDLAGAAVVAGVMKAVAQLALPINLTGLIPLSENMPGGKAMRPGDVVTAMNKRTIRIENTDNEGTVILADVINYGTDHYQPCQLIDIGTFSLGTRKALGAGCSPVFSTSDIIWRELKRAGAYSGDRLWRLPFWKFFKHQVTDYRGVDINNVGKGGGQTCLDASFVKEFVPPLDFAHIDITGTGMKALDDYIPYLRKGLMTGRPTRTLVQLLYQISCPHSFEE